MYFCPCSCSKADGENEEDVLIYLPRNLSYAGESYLDRYSVSSAFVHNGKLEKQLLKADVEEGYVTAGQAACAELRRELQREGEGGEDRREEEESGGGSDSNESEHLLGARAMARPVTCTDDALFRGRGGGGGPDSCDVTDVTSVTLPSPSSPLLPPQLTVTISCDKSADTAAGQGSGEEEGEGDPCVGSTAAESPDSDLVSEEGIFVNMMDDLDGLGGGGGGKSTLSEASDDTYVSGDSMYYSPVEGGEGGDEQARGESLKVSLEEAVQQAAFTFHPPSSSSPPPQDHSPPPEGCPGDSSAMLPLPLPHADDGESGDNDNDGDGSGGSAVSPTHNGVAPVAPQSRDSAAPEGEEDFANVLTLASLGNPPTGPEVQLTDLSVAAPPAPPSEERKPLSSSYRDLLSPDSPLYEDREFNFTRTELRKSTSLKSTKTPPGTPRRKKVVRFADALGLDLESVRHVLNLESPPKIPPSAMRDLHPGLTEDRKAMGSRFLTETFAQPGADVHFRDRVMAEKVVLENAVIVAGSITGVVRVANVGFHKAVRVRFSTNGWATFHDMAASYMAHSNDGPTDRFSFTLVPPPDFGPGSRLECAISYSVNGVDYWDNNYGNNYTFECYAKTVPTEAENAWMHFL